MIGRRTPGWLTSITLRKGARASTGSPNVPLVAVALVDKFAGALHLVRSVRSGVHDKGSSVHGIVDADGDPRLAGQRCQAGAFAGADDLGEVGARSLASRIVDVLAKGTRTVDKIVQVLV